MKFNTTQFHQDFQNKVSPVQKKVAPVELYEFDLSDLAARQMELDVEEELFGSWAKSMNLTAEKDGLRNPGWWTSFYQCIAGTYFKDMRANAISNSVLGVTHSVMQFLPQGLEATEFIAQIAQAQLGSRYEVVVVNGRAGVKNATAEKLVKDAVAAAKIDGKHVWVISNGMADRSFSIPEIDVVLLTTDGGQVSTTLQRLARALTFGEDDKVGRVISVAVDPRLDDKVSPIILDTAVKYSKENNVPIEESLRLTHAAVPLFALGAGDNIVQVKRDEYIARAMELNSVRQLAVSRKAIQSILLDDAVEIVEAIIQKIKRGNRLGEKDAFAKKGKSLLEKAKREGKAPRDLHKNVIQLLTEQLSAFAENIHSLVYIACADTPQLKNILDDAEADELKMEAFMEVTGMAPSTVRECVEHGLIDVEWADLALIKSDDAARAARA